MSRVSLSDLLNSENQAKFRLVKATLAIRSFFFYRYTYGENSIVFIAFTQFHRQIRHLEVEVSCETGQIVEKMEKIQLRQTTMTYGAFMSSRKDKVDMIQAKLTT